MDFKTEQTLTITLNSSDIKEVRKELMGMKDLWTDDDDKELKSIYWDGFFGKLWSNLE